MFILALNTTLSSRTFTFRDICKKLNLHIGENLRLYKIMYFWYLSDTLCAFRGTLHACIFTFLQVAKNNLQLACDSHVARILGERLGG